MADKHKEVSNYSGNCIACHATGGGNRPRFADILQWLRLR
jgi:mono/diheme cytochrome c family protein